MSILLYAEELLAALLKHSMPYTCLPDLVQYLQHLLA